VRLAIVALALLSSSAGAQQLEDWEQPSRLDILHKSFAVLAHTCATDFGFTALAAPALDEARDKLKAYLDLSGHGEAQERAWLTLMEHRNSLLGKDGSIATRASDALEAAVDDPSTYSQAEQLYVDTVTQGQRDVLADCKALADDPYIGTHYLAGVGRNRGSEDQLKKDFADSVKELTAYKAKVMPKRGRHR
jgi:hypothetical protein